MNDQVTAKEIADSIGSTKRAVLIRAKKEGWNCDQAKNKAGGGFQQLFLVDTLPGEIKTKLFQQHLACHEDIIPRDNIDLQKAECLLDRWKCASLKNQDRATVRLKILKAIDQFCEEKGFRQTKGEEIFLLFYGDKKAPGIEADTYGIEKTVSAASVRRWRCAYRKDGLSGLLPNYRSTQGRLKAITPEIKIFIMGHIKQKPHIKPAHLHKLIKKQFDLTPSRRTLYRFVNQWKTENPSLWAMIEDPQRWKNNFMPAAGDMSAGIDHFGHTWELDSTPADIITSDGSRCTIVGSIDVFSRRAKLVVAPTSKSTAIAACLRECFLSWGIVHNIRKDNGKDYSSAHIEAIISALGITVVPLPKYSPEKKPFIERFFGTFSVGLEELLPGYCGHSVADRQTIRARETWASKIMEQGGTVEIPLTLSELKKICDQWIQIYERSPHSGLGNKTPYQKFQESSYFPQKIRDERALDILLAPVSSPRRVLKKGISIDGQYYWANELLDHMGLYVRCRHDLENAGVVYVFERMSGNFLCKAMNDPLTGQRLEEYQSAKKKSLKATKDKIKALDGLAIGNRGALQILLEDTVLNENDNVIPLQFEADNHQIREAKKAASISEDTIEIENTKVPQKVTVNHRCPSDLAFDDYKTEADLDRDLDEIIKSADRKRRFGIDVGKSR